jgi:peptidoglycan/LPS O-acetylase OafA/YrhL
MLASDIDPGPPQQAAVSRPPRPRRGPAHTLASTFSARHNSLAMMRLGLAASVAVAHALDIGFGWQPRLGTTNVSDLAVDGFFVLSGFLVTRSLLRLRSVKRYAWHRFLRIMPGFWVCLLVTAVVFAPVAAALVDREPLSVFTHEHSAWRYATVNAALPILQFDIAGITAPNGEDVFDGALWTLQYEAVCYALLVLLGIGAVLRRRPSLLLLLIGGVWALAVADRLGAIPWDVPVLLNESLFRFLLVFLLGAAGYVFADRVPIGRLWAAGAAAAVVAAAFLPDYRLVAAAGFAYLCLYGMVRLPLRWTPAWDLSYGLYVYHWPVQFVLLLAGVAAVGEVGFVLITVSVSLALAALSWLVIEGPALRLKDAPMPRLRRRPAAEPQG